MPEGHQRDAGSDRETANQAAMYVGTTRERTTDIGVQATLGCLSPIRKLSPQRRTGAKGKGIGSLYGMLVKLKNFLN